MSARARAIVPLALVVGALAFLWCEFALNLQFHWLTDGDLGNGLSLPADLQIPVWVAFVTWGLFFCAGGDGAAATKIAIAGVFGSLGALGTFLFAPALAGLPDFWAISLMVGVFSIILVLIAILGDWYYVAGTFPCFAACFGWWVATGLDNWVPNGGGVGNSVQALGDPTTAGAGVAGGVLSTGFGWVWLGGLISLLAGVVLGVVSAKVTAVVTPRPKAAPEATAA